MHTELRHDDRRNPMMLKANLHALMAGDRARMQILEIVRGLQLRDCWVAAGFVRSLVWDHLHGRAFSALPSDVDVIWYDSDDASPERDAQLESLLMTLDSSISWSVKNQARMHQRNADQPYACATEAMMFWPETATAIGVRLGANGVIEIAAPLGLQDLFSLVVRPTSRFLAEKHSIYLERVRAKSWHLDWPLLQIMIER